MTEIDPEDLTPGYLAADTDGIPFLSTRPAYKPSLLTRWRMRRAGLARNASSTSTMYLMVLWNGTVTVKDHPGYHVVVTYVGDACTPDRPGEECGPLLHRHWEVEWTKRRRDGHAGKVNLDYFASDKDVVQEIRLLKNVMRAQRNSGVAR